MGGKLGLLQDLSGGPIPMAVALEHFPGIYPYPTMEAPQGPLMHMEEQSLRGRLRTLLDLTVCTLAIALIMPPEVKMGGKMKTYSV